MFELSARVSGRIYSNWNWISAGKFNTKKEAIVEIERLDNTEIDKGVLINGYEFGCLHGWHLYHEGKMIDTGGDVSDHF